MSAYRRFCDWLLKKERRFHAYRRLSDSLGLKRFLSRREPNPILADKRIARNRKKLEAQGWRSGQWRWRVIEGGSNVTPMRKAK